MDELRLLLPKLAVTLAVAIVAVLLIPGDNVVVSLGLGALAFFVAALWAEERS